MSDIIRVGINEDDSLHSIIAKALWEYKKLKGYGENWNRRVDIKILRYEYKKLMSNYYYFDAVVEVTEVDNE